MQIIFDKASGIIVGAGDLLPADEQEIMDWPGFDRGQIGRARVVKRNGKLAIDPIPQPAPPIEMLRAGALTRALTIIGALSRPIKSGYTDDEVDSWPTQAAEARAVLAGGGAADAPTLVLIAAKRNVTLAQIAAMVSANATSYAAIMVAGQGLRRQAEAAIAATATPAEIDTALADIREQVMAVAQAMGLGEAA